MKFINSLSLAPSSKDWLANSRQAHILHIFDNACNLINERSEILSIVARQIGNGPFNLVIEEDVLFSTTLSSQSPITFSATQLNIGDLSIHTVGAELWRPRPEWEVLHAKRDDIFHSLRKIEIFPTINLQSPFSNSLASALATANLPTAITAAKKLAGLGIGLTPAGDDFILGAVLAAWIIHPPETASTLAREITNIGAPLTTSLSAAWLRSVGRGEAGILWHNFFDALTSGDSSAVELKVSKILSIGHTSGADALAGFIGTFISYAETETRLCHS